MTSTKDSKNLKIVVFCDAKGKPQVACFSADQEAVENIIKGLDGEANKTHEVPFLIVGDGTLLAAAAQALQKNIVVRQIAPFQAPSHFGSNDAFFDDDEEEYDDNDEDE